jgi:hypothetical protein
VSIPVIVEGIEDIGVRGPRCYTCDVPWNFITIGGLGRFGNLDDDIAPFASYEMVNSGGGAHDVR